LFGTAAQQFTFTTQTKMHKYPETKFRGRFCHVQPNWGITISGPHKLENVGQQCNILT